MWHREQCLVLPCCRWAGSLLRPSSPEIPGQSSPSLELGGLLHAGCTLGHRSAKQRAAGAICSFYPCRQPRWPLLVGMPLGRHDRCAENCFRLHLANDPLGFVRDRSPLPHRGIEGVQERFFICEISHCPLEGEA